RQCATGSGSIPAVAPRRPRPLPPEARPQAEAAPRRIGGEIRGLRRAKAMTLSDVAAASGLSIGHLSLVERDRATPSINALHAISRALGVTISWFFEAREAPDDERALVVRRGRRRRRAHSAGIGPRLWTP